MFLKKVRFCDTPRNYIYYCLIQYGHFYSDYHYCQPEIATCSVLINQIKFTICSKNNYQLLRWQQSPNHLFESYISGLCELLLIAQSLPLTTRLHGDFPIKLKDNKSKLD